MANWLGYRDSPVDNNLYGFRALQSVLQLKCYVFWWEKILLAYLKIQPRYKKRVN